MIQDVEKCNQALDIIIPVGKYRNLYSLKTFIAVEIDLIVLNLAEGFFFESKNIFLIISSL